MGVYPTSHAVSQIPVPSDAAGEENVDKDEDEDVDDETPPHRMCVVASFVSGCRLRTSVRSAPTAREMRTWGWGPISAWWSYHVLLLVLWVWISRGRTSDTSWW